MPALVGWILPSLAVALAAYFLALYDWEEAGGTPPLPPRPSPAQNAIWVIGDLHGDAVCARHWVRRTGLISADGQGWTDPTSRIVFVGDYVDKGRQARETVIYVRDLTERFPDHVTALLGNHEMELLLDRDARRWESWGGAGFHGLAYASAHPGDYVNYLGREADRDDDLVVEALYNASIEVYGNGLHQQIYMASKARVGERSILRYVPEDLRPIVSERLDEDQRDYLDAFRSGTALGDWLESRPIVAQLNDTIFVHGGLGSESSILLGMRGVEGVNGLFREFSGDRTLKDFIEHSASGRAIYEMLTYRGNHRQPCPSLAELLPAGASRLGVGHTPGDSVRIMCDGKFLALDSSLGRWFRLSGNEYCPGDVARLSSNGRYTCGKMGGDCEGQIVRLQHGSAEVIYPII